MKTCPICHAVAFDDAEVCFGCLFNFKDGTTEPDAEQLGPLAATGASLKESTRKRPRKTEDELPLALAIDEDPSFSESVEIPYDYVPFDEEPAYAGAHLQNGGQAISPPSRTTAPDDCGAPDGTHVIGVKGAGALPITFRMALTPMTDEKGNQGWDCTFTLCPP